MNKQTDLLDRLEKAIDRSTTISKFMAGLSPKRIDGEFTAKYTWELFSINGNKVNESRWEGFDTLEETIIDLLKNIH